MVSGGEFRWGFLYTLPVSLPGGRDTDGKGPCLHSLLPTLVTRAWASDRTSTGHLSNSDLGHQWAL